MPSALRFAFLLAALAPLGACNFWVIPIPIPIPVGATTLEPVPVEEGATTTAGMTTGTRSGSGRP